MSKNFYKFSTHVGERPAVPATVYADSKESALAKLSDAGFDTSPILILSCEEVLTKETTF